MTHQKMSLEGQIPSHFAQERKDARGMRGSISFWKELDGSGYSREEEHSEKAEESTRKTPKTTKTSPHFFGEWQGLFIFRHTSKNQQKTTP